MQTDTNYVRPQCCPKLFYCGRKMRSYLKTPTNNYIFFKIFTTFKQLTT